MPCPVLLRKLRDADRYGMAQPAAERAHALNTAMRLNTGIRLGGTILGVRASDHYPVKANIVLDPGRAKAGAAGRAAPVEAAAARTTTQPLQHGP